MPNYNKSKIYKLYSLSDLSKIYIGSTTQSLALRKGGHISSYKHFLKGNNSKITSFDIIECGNVKIELIEECCCDNKEQLHMIEAKYIREMECVNKCIPCRTPAQYRLDNVKKIQQDNVKRKNVCYQHTCVKCGSVIQRREIRRHQRSQKCQKALKQSLTVID